MNSKWNNKLTEKSAFKGGEIVPDSNPRRHTNTHTHAHTNARTARSLTAQKFGSVPAAAAENQQHIQLTSLMDQRQSAGATNNITTAVIKAHFTLPQSARPRARSHLSELAAGSHLSIKFPLWPTGRGGICSFVFGPDFTRDQCCGFDFCSSESPKWAHRERKPGAWLVWDDCKVIDRADGTQSQIRQQIYQDVTVQPATRGRSNADLAWWSFHPQRGNSSQWITFMSRKGEKMGVSRRCCADRLFCAVIVRLIDASLLLRLMEEGKQGTRPVKAEADRGVALDTGGKTPSLSAESLTPLCSSHLFVQWNEFAGWLWSIQARGSSPASPWAERRSLAAPQTESGHVL